MSFFFVVASTSRFGFAVFLLSRPPVFVRQIEGAHKSVNLRIHRSVGWSSCMDGAVKRRLGCAVRGPCAHPKQGIQVSMSTGSNSPSGVYAMRNPSSPASILRCEEIAPP